MNETETAAPHAVIERLVRAWNDHDIEAFVACFDPDYRSDQPAHPARTFEGREQVRENWSSLFASMADFLAELLSFAEEGERAWAEWRWTGTQTDGSPFEWRGVTLFGVRDDRIVWSRLYMEPVERAGADIEQTIGRMARGRKR
jgi:ketosteroid isomerase-like protein